MTTYLLAGGGTAGHVNPMIAIANALRERDSTCDIVMLGTSEGLESRLVPLAGFELETIPRLPFPRRMNLDALAFPARFRRTVRRVKALLASRDVDVVIGVGGYAAAPAYAAARAQRIPFVVHEANARPGLANRLGARWTPFVGVAIEGTSLKHARVVGMPLRSEFEHPVTPAERRAARASFGLNPDMPTLVVTGGSLGARHINESIISAMPDLLDSGVQVLHITGNQTPAITSVGEGHVVIEYCDRMRDALACGNLVIARAGASTVCEIAALGVPAIFVPYPVGNGEQRFNAATLVKAEAALLILDSDFTPSAVRHIAVPLIRDRDRLDAMAQRSQACGIRDGRARVVALIDEARRASV